MTRDEVIAAITAAFTPTERPGDAFLQGSREGCEPFEEISPFFGKEWNALDAPFLDERYSALLSGHTKKSQPASASRCAVRAR